MKNFLFGVFILLASISLAEPLGVEERQQLADGLYSRGMYSLAADEYRSILEGPSGNAPLDAIHFRLAESYRHMGRLEEAQLWFERLFADFPKSDYRYKAGFKAADILRETGNHDKAVQQIKRLLEVKPPDDIAAAALFFMGESFLAQGNTVEAKQAFERVTQEHATSDFCSYSLLKLAGIYGQLTDEEQAKLGAAEKNQRFVKALTLYKSVSDKPSSDRVGAEALFQTAELYFNQKDFTASAAAYRQLLVKYPKDYRSSDARRRAAWAAHNAGLYADSLKYATETLAAAEVSERDEWLYLKANSERQLIKTADAIATYAQLLKDYANSKFAAPAMYETAVTYYQMGDFAGAIAAASRVNLTGDIKKDVYWLLAESHSALKQFDEATQFYRLIVRDFPKSNVACDAMYRLAHHLRISGKHKEAALYYAKVVDGFPNSELAPSSLFASASCLSALNMHAEAARDWDRLIKQYANHALIEESLYQKAMTDIRLGRDDESLRMLDELLRRFPKSKFLADAHYWRGMLLKESGKFEDAVIEFGLVLKSMPGKTIEQDAKFQLAVVLQKTGKLDEAARLFQETLASPLRTKCSPALLEWLSEYMFQKKQIDEAIEAARVLIDVGRDAQWKQIGWCLVGRGLNAKGDSVGAEKAFKCALETKSRTTFASEAALRLGDIALNAGRYEESGGYYKQAAALASDENLLVVRAHAYAGIGKAAIAAGDSENAARYFMSVAILFDEENLVSECLYNAAAIFRGMGKHADAERIVDELRQRYPKSRWAAKSVELTKNRVKDNESAD
ncbi:MAG: tetratricopeptide repeat protein [Lentisphaerae bacterium]|nr:tetratricopeptide repeat protein [Lentisphaerota bacterium]